MVGTVRFETLRGGIVRHIQAEFLAAQGIDTVFITGTTGECHSLTCGEKLTLYDAWAQAAPHALSSLPWWRRACPSCAC